MALFWLSFADSDLPEGTQFLGAAIIEAPDFTLAVMFAHSLGCNPGGEVMSLEFPPQLVPAQKWRNRLLTRAECEQFDAEQAGVIQ